MLTNRGHFLYKGVFMHYSKIFGSHAKWICAEDTDAFPLFCKQFFVKDVVRAELRIFGTGSYVFYVNGKRGCDDYFLPLNSEFEPRENYPAGQKLTAFRAYAMKYDVTHLLRDGNNAFSVMLGNGWYTGLNRPFSYQVKYGDKKLIYALTVETTDGTQEIYSDEGDLWRPSFVTEHIFVAGEKHDYRAWNESLLCGGGAGWKKAVLSTPVNGEVEFTDCPTDKLIARIAPVQTEVDGTMIYDAGENLTGYPVIICSPNSTIEVRVSEELDKDGKLNEKYMHHQYFTVTTGDEPQEAIPLFTWLGFRYFTVTGNATVKEVHKIHTKLTLGGTFTSSDENLNWLYQTYINTERTNVHWGTPMDCPHIERRAYTGDGQLTSRIAMLSFRAQKLYDKWLQDISDGQDQISGRVHNTAPYTRSGGAPGGFDGAMVNIPYQYWKVYGDDKHVRKMFDQMLKYFDFMEGISVNNLIFDDIPATLSLGEWCTPGKRFILPPPFVNTYFYVKNMMRAIEIARHIGKEDVIPMLEERIAIRKKAITCAYYNTTFFSYFAGEQGADAFALDIGLGDPETKNLFIERYENLPTYDTGIFGTEVVTRLLCEYGRADIAYKLLTADKPHGFIGWKKQKATTLHEYWFDARSHSHPMFGGVLAVLYDYFLGVQAVEGGYKTAVIRPAVNCGLSFVRGSISTPYGELKVAWQVDGDKVTVTTDVPDAIHATLCVGETEVLLSKGSSSHEIQLA